MRRVRTFIAIDTGKKIRDRLVSLQENLIRAGVKAKWVEPENMHLTLLFLGEVDMISVPEICAAVEQTAQEHAAFSMSIGSMGCFPHIRRPRILWAGVTDGAEQICALHDDLEEPLLELGCYRREERKYSPHLTLGRLEKEKTDVELAPLLEKYDDWQGGQALIKEVLVMSSELTPKGPIYTVLSRADLT